MVSIAILNYRRVRKMGGISWDRMMGLQWDDGIIMGFNKGFTRYIMLSKDFSKP
jgi:hypothetical protein